MRDQAKAITSASIDERRPSESNTIVNPLAAAAVALAIAASPHGARADDGAVEETVRDTVAGGTHWRLSTSGGIIHVWRPRLYDKDRAGTVLYVHGYYNDVDQAWSDHRLAEQFRDSRINALFIVPQAPASDDEHVHFRDLRELLLTVQRMTKRKLPLGPVSALGFSGGFRTIVEWLTDGRVQQVLLLDGLYYNEDDFASWLKTQHGRKGNKLLLVASETTAKSDAFVKRFPGVPVRGLPENAFELNKQDREAEVLYLRTTVEHMSLVTDGKVIPLLLQLTPLKRI
jgi:hypothetical protein